MTTRIGVVADTHCPEFLDELPGALFEVLAGVDMLIHAGDVGGRSTLDELARIAPVHAVSGDHDRRQRLDLGVPDELTLEVEGIRLAVVHGDRSHLVEEPVTLLGTLSLGLAWPTPGLHRNLRRRFPDADVVIHGHTHTPVAAPLPGGGLVFNPGAVYQVTPEAARQRLARDPDWFEWSWLQVIRRRVRWPQPSVGILEVNGRAVRPVHVPLD